MYYENKITETIREDVKKEFKRIEKSRIWRYRDDQEIYEAWENIIDRYINQLSNADWMRIHNRTWWVKDGKARWVPSENLYKWEALKYFIRAKNEFKRKRKEVIKKRSKLGLHKIGIYITSRGENDLQLDEVANSIDEAENKALERIKEVCNPKQRDHNASEYSTAVRDKRGNIMVKKWEVVRQIPLFTHTNDGTLTFTKRVNPIKIDKALGTLFDNKGVTYRIDYTKCTNPRIKKRMLDTIWWLSCWIRYSQKFGTYVLSDKKWNILSKRALVWEWVTLKQDTILKSQNEDGDELTVSEQQDLRILSSISKRFEFNANNYGYYAQFSKSSWQNICASYAYWVVSDILAKQWRCFNAQEISAWKISGQSYITNHFNITKLNDNPQQQIVNAPAWTLLTMRYDNTKATWAWVSHVMVSLWNWVYTDLFWTTIRTIDFKSKTKFSWKKFTYWWLSYTLTEDSRLMSPKLSTFVEWSEETLTWKNITPDEFAKKVHESTWANTNYIRSLIMKQNGISFWNFNTRVDNISVNIVTKNVTKLELENTEWSSDVANGFLNSLKNHKKDIMNHYPNLTNHEYDEIAKRAIWILYQESDAWDSLKYKWKEVAHSLTLSSLPGNRSRWYTQIKYNSLFSQSDKDFLTNFGINGWSDFTNPEKCWIWTMVWLINNYNNTIIPMKTDPFWKNDAEIIELKFKDWKSEYIAKWKSIKIWNEKRPRTEAEIQGKIKDWWNSHWWIVKEKTIIRPWITKDDDFFDFLYYARNKPSEIYYWTATPDQNNYIAQSNWYIKEHTVDKTYNA